MNPMACREARQCQLSFFVAKAPVAFLTNRLAQRKDLENNLEERLSVEKQKHVYAYVEPANFVLNLYATDDVIAKATAKVEAFEQRSETKGNASYQSTQRYVDEVWQFVCRAMHQIKYCERATIQRS